MADIDGYHDVLSAPMRAVWPRAARIASATGGVLVGGTAVAVHLRHRRSEDLDILTPSAFDTAAVRDRLEADADRSFVALARSRHEVLVLLDDVRVHVFEDPQAEHRLRVPRPLQPGPTIDGMPVASLPDLLALKLDTLLWRSSLRDLLDLAAIDSLTAHRLEDGIRCYRLRFGPELDSGILDNLIFKLRFPPAGDADPLFDDARDATVAYLKQRARDVEEELHRQRATAAMPAEPPTTSEQPGSLDT